MSRKKKTSGKARVVDETTDDESIEDAAATATESDDSEAADSLRSSSPAATVTQRRGSGAVAWLALIISAVAIAALAFDYLQDRSAAGDTAESSAEMNTLIASMSATQEALASVEQNVAAMRDLDAEMSARIESLGQQLNNRLRQVESMPGRLSSVEASMAAIQGISTGARDAWLLAEAEYYMQIANAQLQLANNPELAKLALTHADDRILQLADPRLTNVRQALSDELRALEVIAGPDTAGITLTLASLAGAVDSLPLRQEVAVGDNSEAALDAELSGVDRAMESLKNAVGGVVSVRRADEAMQPLIAPEAQYFLRANLALQLQAARLALLRGEEDIFRQSLQDADAWLAEYYDPGSTGVESARMTISEIRDSVFTIAVPDISQSLRLLRQFNALTSVIPTSDAEQDQ